MGVWGRGSVATHSRFNQTKSMIFGVVMKEGRDFCACFFLCKMGSSQGAWYDFYIEIIRETWILLGMCVCFSAIQTVG